jgi:hypothetical protein
MQLTKQNTRIAVIGPGGFLALSVAEILALPDAPVVEEEKTTDPPPVTPIDPKPVPVEPAKPAITEADLLGVELPEKRWGNPLFVGLDQVVIYEKADGKLWPRTLVRIGQAISYRLEVPPGYVLPEGWGWWQAKDKAWAIVPYKTDLAGPAWLLKPETPAPTPVVTLPAPTGGDDEEIAYKQA